MSTADAIMEEIQHQFRDDKMDFNTRDLFKKKLHTYVGFLKRFPVSSQLFAKATMITNMVLKTF